MERGMDMVEVGDLVQVQLLAETEAMDPQDLSELLRCHRLKSTRKNFMYPFIHGINVLCVYTMMVDGVSRVLAAAYARCETS
jgi:hypothetical protein